MHGSRHVISRSVVATPIGRLALSASPIGLTQIDLLRDDTLVAPLDGHPEATAHLASAARALANYFSGARDAFRDVVAAPEGTGFQRLVWSALQEIPEGTTISYGELATRIGKPEAVRAVGLANGRNPIPIVVPCHRVIGADRSLTGFGLGVPVKAWLLVHERAAEPFSGTVTAGTRVVRRATLWAADDPAAALPRA